MHIRCLLTPVTPQTCASKGKNTSERFGVVFLRKFRLMLKSASEAFAGVANELERVLAESDEEEDLTIL